MDRRKIFWLGIYLANWGIIFYYWFYGSGSLLWAGKYEFLISFGRIAGLGAAYMILLQFFLMGRMLWLEGVFGLDKLSRVHHKNGKWGMVLLLIHPVFLVFGYSGLSGFGLWDQFVSFLVSYEHVNWAFLGAGLFFAVIATSIYIVRRHMSYEFWYVVHLLAYAAVFFSFWHQISIGETLLGSNLFYWYWITLYIIVFGNHLLFRVLRPFYFFGRHRFFVERVTRESPSSVSVYISGDNIAEFAVRPGQFMIFRFLARGYWWQAHPFSLSKVPDGKSIRITVKELGDYTKRIKDLRAGTRVFIDGPYGVFTDFLGMSSKVLLIAGGIGITPIRSLSEELLKKGKDVVLLYANKDTRDIVFQDELDELRQKYPARIIHILSDDPAYQGEQGRIDEEKLRRLVPDAHEREVYLCGPGLMMDGLLRIFEKLGIASSRVHYEKFSL